VLEEWERLIPELRAGSFDAITANMSITKRRRQLVSFTERYCNNVVRFVARKSSGFDPVNTAGSGVGKPVAVREFRIAKRQLGPIPAHGQASHMNVATVGAMRILCQTGMRKMPTEGCHCAIDGGFGQY